MIEDTTTRDTGFADPIGAAQSIFRTLMDASARPGSRQPIPVMPAGPQGIPRQLAAIALALADFETPVWLGPGLAGHADCANYLRFHTGAPLVEDPALAAFALVSDAERMPALSTFAQGTLEYPDRSTTVIIAVSDLQGGTLLRLRGPGIRDEAQIAPRPQPDLLADQLAMNRAAFPLGVDLIFASPDEVAAIPRSVRVVTGS